MPSEVKTASTPSSMSIRRLPQSCAGSYQGTQAPNWFSTYSYRNRSWNRQRRPYVKTLAYNDLVTDFHGGEFSFTITENSSCGPSRPDITVYTGSGGTYGDSTYGKDIVENHSLPSVSSAQLAVLNAVRDAKWNFPVFAAEAGKTCEMVWQTAKKLAEAYRSLRRRDYKKVLSALELNKPSGPRDLWLSYRYGWTPMLSDVKSMAEAAASCLVDEPPTMFVKKRGGVVETYSLSYGSGKHLGIQSSMPAGLNGPKALAIKQQSAAWLLVCVRNKTLMRLEQFGLANPMAVAWELVPFSFVADWFVGVGDYLAAQTALLGLEVLDGGTSQLSIRTYTTRVTGVNPGAWNLRLSGVGPSGVITSRKYVRNVWNGAPPTFPAYGTGLNTKRTADAAALISAVFGGAKSSSNRY